MSNWHVTFWADLVGAISAAIPTLTSISRVTQVQRRNWSNDIDSGALTSPWCLVQVGKEAQDESGEWGSTVRAYLVPVQIYIIRETSGTNIAADLEADAAALQDTLDLPSAYSFLVPLQGFEIDASEENPINISMLEADMPYQSVSFGFTAVAGYAP